MPQLITPPPPPPVSVRYLRLGIVTGGAALLAYAVMAPALTATTGVDPGLAARAPALHGGLHAGMSAVWLLSVQLATTFPIGDFTVRVRLISLVAGAAAVGLLLWRSLVVRLHDAAPVASPAPPRAPVEIVAALWGVATVALSRSFVAAATSVGPCAIGALLALALLTLAERLARAPGDRRSWRWLAFLAGLAGGGPLAAAALGWPIGALILVRAFRRGAVGGGLGREPVPVPVGATALVPLIVGLGIGVGVIGQAAEPNHLAEIAGRVILLPVFRALAHLSTGALAAAAVELLDQIGILAAMVAFAGLSTLRRTSLIFTLWSLAAGLVLRAAFGSGAEGALGMVLAAMALALPLGAGIVRLAERLGRARLPAAAALGVIVATWPLLAK